MGSSSHSLCGLSLTDLPPILTNIIILTERSSLILKTTKHKQTKECKTSECHAIILSPLCCFDTLAWPGSLRNATPGAQKTDAAATFHIMFSLNAALHVKKVTKCREMWTLWQKATVAHSILHNTLNQSVRCPVLAVLKKRKLYGPQIAPSSWASTTCMNCKYLNH